MAKSKYLTSPVPSKKMPAGIPYILTTEATERLAFYGMSSILIVFMTKYLMGPHGMLNVMADEPAKAWFHLFTGAVYFMAIVGAVISDAWLGKYKTIVWFSLLYCAGFFVMAWDHTRVGLTAGLILIAAASGIIKPCLTANVGDQFGVSNKHLIEKVYSWFYFSINLGATISMFSCPILLDKYGPTVGFGVPGAFMLVATLSYWLGRYRLVHIPPAGKTSCMSSIPTSVTVISCLLIISSIIGMVVATISGFTPLIVVVFISALIQMAMGIGMILGRNWARYLFLILTPISIVIGLRIEFASRWIYAIRIFCYVIFAVLLNTSKVREYFRTYTPPIKVPSPPERKILDKEGARAVGKLCIIFLFVSMFFALFYQSESAWVLQAEKMNLRWLGMTWRPAQMQSANPFLIMVLIPIFLYAIYPGLNRLWTLTPLRKIGIGMFLTAASFLIPVWIENQLEVGIQPSIGWQFIAYIFLTGAEVMVSITVLEFAYTQAPQKMKSLIQSAQLLSISLGNFFTAAVNSLIKNEDGTSKLPGASYYWFFVIAMLVTAILFIPLARWYKPREYIQDESPVESSA